MWFSGVAQAEKGAADPMEAKFEQALQEIMGIEKNASLLTHLQKLTEYAYGLYSFILNFVWVGGAASLVYVVAAPAAGEYGEPDSRFEGQYLKAGHYICPAAHTHFLASEYYTANPTAFNFTADDSSGMGSFDYIYTLLNIIGYFVGVCCVCCFSACAIAALASKQETRGAGRTMR